MTISSHESHNNPSQELQPESSATVDSPVTSSEKLSSITNEPQVRELGGPKGPEPTRFGDWERKGRCVDF